MSNRPATINSQLKTTIKTKAKEIGFHKVGIANAIPNAEQLKAVEHLRNWLAMGYQADMAWMASPKRKTKHQRKRKQ